MGTRENVVPTNILLEERRSPTYYQDMVERWYSSVPPK